MISAIIDFICTDYGDILLYIFEIILSDVLFMIYLPRKKKFFLRLAVSMAVYIAAVLLITKYLQLGYWGYMVTNLLSFAVCPICFQCKAVDWVFCAVAATIVQNISYNIGYLSAIIVGASPNIAEEPYSAMIQVPMYLLAHLVCYLLCSRRLRNVESIGVQRVPMLILAGAAIVIVHFVREMADAFSSNYTTWAIIICCCDVLSLVLLFDMHENSKLKEEKAILEQLMIESAKQFEISEKTIDIINMKCHDLKKQVAMLKLIDEDQTAVKEVQDAIMIYSQMAKTGNKALDVVLSEKGLFCEQSNIALNYMVEGEVLNFMKPVDIAAIFGNAIDNAMKYLAEVEDEKYRIISINAGIKGSFTVIHIENYCDKELKFLNGLPITTTGDGENHGFGLKSIRHSVEKYGGNMTVSLGNDLFAVDIMIPKQ